jgi:hypothetical protein
MMTTRTFLRSALPALGLALAAALLAPSMVEAAKKKKEAPTRTVKGIVTDENENPLQAVVQLKNTRTMDVRSYYVREDGRYFFSGLDLNTDYEVRAFMDGWQEKTRRVSAFDDRTELFYQLTLKPE